METTEIRARGGLLRESGPDLWKHRELLYFLTWRDVRVRYAQSVVGIGWAVLQPLALMVVFAVFFGRLAGVPSDRVPYPLFAYVALVPWTFFSRAVDGAATSLVRNSHLVSKVYFPRLLLPLSALGSFLLDFLIALSLVAVLMFYYGIEPTSRLVWLPLFALLALVAAFGTGAILAALNAQYRDVQFVIPFLLQLWLFASPVAYSTSLIPEDWRAVYGLNPMVAVIDGFRWSLLGTTRAPDVFLWLSCILALLLSVLGVFYFSRVERLLADVI